MTALKVHIVGVGDYSLDGVTGLADPCPLPSAAKKKGLRDKEKHFYAPMSGLGDLLYDKDAVYININDHFVQFSNVDDENGKLNCRGKVQDVGEMMVKSLENTKYSIDEKLEKSFISVFSRKPNISSDTTNNAKDMDDDTEYTHDKQYQTEEVNAGGLGEKHVAVEMDDSKSSDEDADIKKGEILKSVSDSDEDNFVEHVEFNEGQHRRKAIFGYGVDSGDLKVLNCDRIHMKRVRMKLWSVSIGSDFISSICSSLSSNLNIALDEMLDPRLPTPSRNV
ncbi:hypothetical protein WN944_027436 [Citrus x changshan-huyou]|uniref:Uncharacterized protein n=1 Tax=Citrus x changshan-huyou TaxID=2935761 RepID=A0AAP0Q9V8_9ROSI